MGNIQFTYLILITVYIAWMYDYEISNLYIMKTKIVIKKYKGGNTYPS